MAVVARLLAQDEAFRGDFIVHGMWLPRGWWACLRHFGNYVRMTHGSLSPLYLEHQGKWKKRLVRPIERFLLRHARKVLATCEAEARWLRDYEPRAYVAITDLKRFFDLNGRGRCPQRPATDVKRTISFDNRCGGLRTSRPTESARPIHILYLGRRHPLKGVGYLEQAVAELNQSFEHSEHSNIRTFDLRIVSNATGEELEKVWDWCDVLVLPTLSENFGLVVAEALERGKRVVTTDGAPAWEGQPGVVYLKGYREGTDVERVELLKKGLRERSGSGTW